MIYKVTIINCGNEFLICGHDFIKKRKCMSCVGLVDITSLMNMREELWQNLTIFSE